MTNLLESNGLQSRMRVERFKNLAEVTFCGFVSVILACRHLPLKINFIAKIIAQNRCNLLGGLFSRNLI
jgi:hypothetical protein